MIGIWFHSLLDIIKMMYLPTNLFACLLSPGPGFKSSHLWGSQCSLFRAQIYRNSDIPEKHNIIYLLFIYMFGEEKLGEKACMSKIPPQKSQTRAKPAKSDLSNLVGCDPTLLLLFDTFLYIFAKNCRNRISKSLSYTAAEVVPITFSYFRRQFRNVSIRLRWLARWCAGRYPYKQSVQWNDSCEAVHTAITL